MDLALNSLQRLICHKTKPTNQLIFNVAQSVGIVEYSDCVCLEKEPFPNTCPDDNKASDGQASFKSTEECGVPFHCHISQVHSDPEK